jgi:hypothetical protein
MTLELFHSIGENGADSAIVRKFIVENSLENAIEFSNVAYPNALQNLHEITGDKITPVLVVDGRPIRGKTAIIEWIKTNLLTMRA